MKPLIYFQRDFTYFHEKGIQLLISSADETCRPNTFVGYFPLSQIVKIKERALVFGIVTIKLLLSYSVCNFHTITNTQISDTQYHNRNNTHNYYFLNRPIDIKLL